MLHAAGKRCPPIVSRPFVRTMPDGDKRVSRRPTALPPAPDAGAAEAVPPEAPFLCPECSAPCASIETHLRQAHRVYVFRGTRRSYPETVALLLTLLASARPDPEAWETLSAIAGEDHGGRGDLFLASLLPGALDRLEEGRRPAATEGLGQTLAAARAVPLIALLASDDAATARHLALAALAHLEPPVPAVLHQPLRGLVLDRRLPSPLQLAATANLVRSAGADSPLAGEFMDLLTSGLGTARSIERLRQLEQLLGPTPAVARLCEALEERVRMSCPRCGIELRRPEMTQHLWQQHHLVLDGRRVRDPWAVVEEWLDAYRTTGDAEMLERCRVAGQRIDPQQGLAYVHRLVLLRGIDDPEARRGLAEEARGLHASVCPHCYSFVPVPREFPPFFVNAYRGRLSARGYRVEVDDRGLRTRLEIDTPTRRLLRGPEPGRRWTPRALASLAATPLVFLALAVAFGGIDLGVPPFWPVAALLAIAAVADRLTRRLANFTLPPAERARRYAWSILAPRLHEKGFRLGDSAFLAGLALRPMGTRRPATPGLGDLLQRTEAAVLAGEAPPAHLAPLRRLQIEEAAAAGEDPIPLVAAQVARSFDGRLPLACAEHVLADWDSDWWTRGNLARLRILLCDRAFEADFEVRNLLDAGQTAPALGAVLDTARPEALAGLRLLWALRPSCPWDRCGPAVTAFELAADPDSAGLLARHPDLLLLQEEPDGPLVEGPEGGPAPVRILLCSRGVVLQDTLFTAEPLVAEVFTRGSGTELVFGETRFRCRQRCDDLVPRMERWFRYAFRDFLPQLANVERWRPPHRAALLRAWGAVPCPECRHSLLARLGEFGLAQDEAATQVGEGI
jgi:hypothetical protein